MSRGAGGAGRALVASACCGLADLCVLSHGLCGMVPAHSSSLVNFSAVCYLRQRQSRSYLVGYPACFVGALGALWAASAALTSGWQMQVVAVAKSVLISSRIQYAGSNTTKCSDRFKQSENSTAHQIAKRTYFAWPRSSREDLKAFGSQPSFEPTVL